MEVLGGLGLGYERDVDFIARGGTYTLSEWLFWVPA